MLLPSWKNQTPDYQYIIGTYTGKMYITSISLGHIHVIASKMYTSIKTEVDYSLQFS